MRRKSVQFVSPIAISQARKTGWGSRRLGLRHRALFRMSDLRALGWIMWTIRSSSTSITAHTRHAMAIRVFRYKVWSLSTFGAHRVHWLGWRLYAADCSRAKTLSWQELAWHTMGSQLLQFALQLILTLLELIRFLQLVHEIMYYPSLTYSLTGVVALFFYF